MARAGENVLIRRKQGGSALEFASGAQIDFLAGALVEFAGVDKRAALAAAIATPVAGVAAGYKVARGVFTPAAISTDIVSGLATVVAVVVSLDATPTLTHMWAVATIGDQAGTPAAGSFTVVTRKPTGAADVTPVDATTPWVDVAWIAIGL